MARDVPQRATSEVGAYEQRVKAALGKLRRFKRADLEVARAHSRRIPPSLHYPVCTQIAPAMPAMLCFCLSIDSGVVWWQGRGSNRERSIRRRLAGKSPGRQPMCRGQSCLSRP